MYAHYCVRDSTIKGKKARECVSKTDVGMTIMRSATSF